MKEKKTNLFNVYFVGVSQLQLYFIYTTAYLGVIDPRIEQRDGKKKKW